MDVEGMKGYKSVQQSMWGEDYDNSWTVDDAEAADERDEEKYLSTPWYKLRENRGMALSPALTPTVHLPNGKVHRPSGPDPLMVDLPRGTF